MKKTLLIVATIVMTITSVVFWWLYFDQRSLVQTYGKFTKELIKSYGTSIDALFCTADALMGNIKIDKCDKYVDPTMDDTKFLIDEFNMKLDYEYKGK